MSGGESRPMFTYRERSYEDIQRLQQIGGLKDAIYAAYKGDAKELLAFLRSDLPLTHLELHRWMLADLIERRVQHKPNGQRGPSVPTRTGDMKQYIIALCRSELKHLRKLLGDDLPIGTNKAVIEHWGGRLAEDGELINLEINWARIEQALYPSRARTKKK
jgi:hypothetical protein